MPSLYEIKTFWTAENSPGGESIMYFRDGTATVENLRFRLEEMYSACATRFDNQTTWTIAQSGNVVDEETGTLVDEWANAVDFSGAGSSSGQPVPNQAQLLIRWNPQAIVNGRRLKGRTYIPGLSSLTMDAGQVIAGAVTDFQTAAQDFLDEVNGQFVVWHRPTGGTGGRAESAVTASVWNEFAVQRRRR